MGRFEPPRQVRASRGLIGVLYELLEAGRLVRQVDNRAIHCRTRLGDDGMKRSPEHRPMALGCKLPSHQVVNLSWSFNR
jgi:hypothetical protein